MTYARFRVRLFQTALLAMAALAGRSLYATGIPLAEIHAHAVHSGELHEDGHLHAQNFVTASTAWNPGPNQVREGGNPAPGSATFSIMAAGLSNQTGGIDNDHGNNLTADVTALNVPGWGFNEYVAAIDWALDVWDSVSGFTNLGFVADGGGGAGASGAAGHTADIRFTAWELIPGSLLAHSYQPGNEATFGAGGSVAGDIHFDINHIWRDDPTDTANDSGADYDIYTVILHEVGHALGLMHVPSDAGSVMDASYGGARRSLTADDIAGIQAIYGVPEPSTLALAGMAAVLLWGYRRKLSVR